MNTGRRLASLVVLGAAFALGACAPKQAATAVDTKVADTAADEAAVRQVLADIASTFNAGNHEEMLALYRDDVLVSAPGAPLIVGKDAMRTGIASLPPGIAMKMRFDTEELEVSGDLAYERGTFTMEMTDKASGTALPSLTQRHIHLFKREPDGSWKGWRLMENSEEAPPATPQAP